MPTTLYQKYRPRRFDEIVGQDWISRVLKKALSDEKHSHAYLFSGARGTGKTSTARIVAKALNCLDLKDGEPCNKCAACIAINENRFLDLFEIDAASNRGIDEIRQLKERVNFSPAEGRNKVYIIDETHMLTTEAFNALLKTLEEPPQHTVFILATTEPHKIPLTIISRTQRFDFKLGTEGDLGQRVEYILKKEEIEMEPAAIKLIIQGGGGSFRDTETILEKVIRSTEAAKDKKVTLEEVRQILGLTDEKAVQEMMKSLILKDLDSALSILNEVNSQGLSLIQFLKQILELGRILIHNKIGSKESGLEVEIDLKELVKIIRMLSEASFQMRAAAIQILPFELAIVDICGEEKVYKEVFKEEKKREEKVVKNEKVEEVEEKPLPKIQEIKVAVVEEDDEELDELPAADFQKVQEVWGQFLDKMKPNNAPLQAFLSKAEPSGVRGEKIILKVPFKFHKSRIEEHQSKKVISEVFKALLNVSLVPSCIIEEGLRPKIVEEPEETNNADLVEEVFGDMLEE